MEGPWGSNQTDIYWWLHKNKADALEALRADFKLLTEDNQRLTAYETYASLYTNRRSSSGGSVIEHLEAAWAMENGKFSRAPYNLMKQVIDEVTSRLIKSHPRARFITHGGNRSLKAKAEYMQRWNDAQVHRLAESEKFDSIIKNACLYGLGALLFYKAYREDRVESEVCFPGNLFVDLQETSFGRPTRLHHRRFVSKKALKLWFPKFEDQIEHAGTVSDQSDYVSYSNHYLAPQDTVELIESWHLPSFLDKDDKSPDGVRYLWVDQVILQSNPYNRRSFPFAFFTWKQDPHNTFYGIGLAEDLLGTHIDANVTLRRVNKAIEFLPNPYVLVRQGSKVKATDITNAPGTIIEYTGSDPPQIVLPPTVPGDLLSYVREHEARAYKIAGLSSAQALGDRIPPGLETGRAVENYFQVESVPFSTQLRKFEYFIQEVAENHIAVGREIYEYNHKFSVVLPQDKNTIVELKWKEVAIDPREDSYVIRTAPASALSETPAARLAQVERLAMMFPNMSEAVKRDLLNMPDLENEDDTAAATLHNIGAIIEAALDENIFTPPSPFMDLDLFIIRGTMEEQRASEMDIPEQNIATLRRMLTAANTLRQRQLMVAAVQQQGALTPAVPAQGPTGQAPTAVQG